MISAMLLALASFSAPAATPASAAYAGEAVSAGKGHATPPRPVAVAKSRAPVVCHPDASKGRACRHNVVQAEQAEHAEFASADTRLGGSQDHAR